MAKKHIKRRKPTRTVSKKKPATKKKPAQKRDEFVRLAWNDPRRTSKLRYLGPDGNVYRRPEYPSTPLTSRFTTHELNYIDAAAKSLSENHSFISNLSRSKTVPIIVRMAIRKLKVEDLHL